MLAAFKTVVVNLRVVCLYLGVVRASNKNIHIYFYFIFLMELLFVVAKIIGSPGKNDSLLLHSKLF